MFDCVSGTLNPKVRDRWLIGVLDCVSGGILLYICLCGCRSTSASAATHYPDLVYIYTLS